MLFKPSDITDTFGSGGSNVVPGQGVPCLRDILRDILGRQAAPVANVAALQATLVADRADGQQITTLDTYTIWTWKAADTTAADSTHVKPTDIIGGAGGRWVAESTTPEAADVPADIGLSGGTGTLVNGVSTSIAATVTSSSRITVTRSGLGASTAIGQFVVGSRVNGAPGHFVVSSEKTDTSGIETGDQSTFDWHVLG